MNTISRFFRRSADITSPTGTGAGANFLSGLQERNQRNLMEIFNAATPILEEVAKVKPETWRSMTGLFTALESTFGTGVRAIGQGLRTPARMLQSRFTNMAEGFLAPVMVQINSLNNKVEAFAMQNQTGAIWGAGIGFVAGFVLPGSSALWAMVGAGIGAYIQSIADDYEPLTWGDPIERAKLGPEGYLGDTTPEQTFQTAATQGPVPLNKNITYQNWATRGGYLEQRYR